MDLRGRKATAGVTKLAGPPPHHGDIGRGQTSKTRGKAQAHHLHRYDRGNKHRDKREQGQHAHSRKARSAGGWRFRSNTWMRRWQPVGPRMLWSSTEKPDWKETTSRRNKGGTQLGHSGACGTTDRQSEMHHALVFRKYSLRQDKRGL